MSNAFPSTRLQPLLPDVKPRGDRVALREEGLGRRERINTDTGEYVERV